MWQWLSNAANSDLVAKESLSQCMGLRLPAESISELLLPPAVPLPERVVNVQINVQSVDEELPVSWVNTNCLTEMLKEQTQSVSRMPKPPKFYLKCPIFENE